MLCLLLVDQCPHFVNVCLLPLALEDLVRVNKREFADLPETVLLDNSLSEANKPGLSAPDLLLVVGVLSPGAEESLVCLHLCVVGHPTLDQHLAFVFLLFM